MFRNIKNIYIIGIVALVASLGLQSCDTKKQTKPTITVTIEPMRYFVEQIADSLVSVEVMVPKGSSPETYEPTPQQMVNLANSIAYIKVGNLGFERNWMDKLTQNVPSLRVYSADSCIDVLADPCADAKVGDTDPHIWTSPKNAIIIARNICDALVDIDSIHADIYRSNLKRYTEKVNALDTKIHEKLKTTTHRAFLIYHPTLTYFAHDYGLQQVSVETNGKEPTPQQLRLLIDMCKAQNITTVFVQKEFNRSNIDLITKQIGLKSYSINPLSYDWEKEMLNITNILSNEH